MLSNDKTVNSCATFAIEDDSFFDNVLGKDKQNLSSYQFDEKNEFNKEENNTLITFKDFSKRDIIEFT